MPEGGDTEVARTHSVHVGESVGPTAAVSRPRPRGPIAPGRSAGGGDGGRARSSSPPRRRRGGVPDGRERARLGRAPAGGGGRDRDVHPGARARGASEAARDSGVRRRQQGAHPVARREGDGTWRRGAPPDRVRALPLGCGCRQVSRVPKKGGAADRSRLEAVRRSLAAAPGRSRVPEGVRGRTAAGRRSCWRRAFRSEDPACTGWPRTGRRARRLATGGLGNGRGGSGGWTHDIYL